MTEENHLFAAPKEGSAPDADSTAAANDKSSTAFAAASKRRSHKQSLKEVFAQALKSNPPKEALIAPDVAQSISLQEPKALSSKKRGRKPKTQTAAADSQAAAAAAVKKRGRRPRPKGPITRVVNLEVSDIPLLMEQGVSFVKNAELPANVTEIPVVQPFTKWAGTKRRVLPQLLQLVPEHFETYIEPFVGSGAMYFALAYRAKKSYINDCNAELMNTYVQLRDNLEELKSRLRTYRNEKEFYLEVRNRDREPDFEKTDSIDRAVRLLYLLRTCYNGLYRVNSKNYFNTPFGRYEGDYAICRDEILDPASAYLKACNTELSCADYRTLVEHMQRDSFVYFDPPYMPVSDTSYFTDYQMAKFDLSEQRKLAEFCREIDKKGVKFMLSNSDCEKVRELYEGFKIHEVSVPRMINSIASSRGMKTELAVTNY